VEERRNYRQEYRNETKKNEIQNDEMRKDKRQKDSYNAPCFLLRLHYFKA
jgi:hypothetical protein